MPSDTESALRHDWTESQAEALFQLPFNDLIFQAQAYHRRYFDANQVQLSRLVSVKTGGCPEDCAYCPQSAHHETGVRAEKMMAVEDVLDLAEQARDGGATRYCMGAAWRNPKDSDLDGICAMVEGVKGLGLESCATLGMLTRPQAQRLKQAGLDYYNHNLDTSEEFYGRIITTRTYRDRLETLANVRLAGIKVCSGGIVGMGESQADRAGMLCVLANLKPHPESVPINMLVRVEGTPLAGADDLDGIEFVRTIAAAKTMMPASVIRLSAGREQMTDEMQALCFLAGAGSIFVGEKLLTTPNPETDADARLFERLGLEPARAPQ
jgi:biotin synthase